MQIIVVNSTEYQSNQVGNQISISGMEQVDNCDGLAIEFVPELIASPRVVNEEVFGTHHSDFSTLGQEDFFLGGMSSVHRWGQSKSIEVKIIVDDSNE